MKKIRIIARNSRLSRLQVEEVVKKFPHLSYVLKVVPSYGDRHKQVPLIEGNVPADFFTRELDEALLCGEADLAIHSAKDLPYPLPQGLEVIALFPPFDATDALVSRDGLTLEALPPGSKVGTSSPMRRKNIFDLRPDLQTVSLRGTIEERVQQVADGCMDAAIVATCALKRLGLEGLISQILPFPTHPLQGYLAITAREGRDDLKSLFRDGNELLRQGKVTLVGAGPGNPEWLTVAGLRALKEADVIFHDDLIDKDFLQTFLAKKIYVGKRSGRHHVEQETIHHKMLTAARKGKNVVRLKGGDPMLFSHGGEEVEYLQRHLVAVSVVPGITTAAALSARLKIPLTQRGISSGVALMNGHTDYLVCPETDTVIYYMAGSRLSAVRESLLGAGRAKETPVLLVSHVSMPNESVVETTLGELQGDFPTPLIVLVGEVAALRRKAAKDIRRTLYTGTVCPRPDFIHTPLIEIHSCAWSAPKGEFDFILFTSRHAVAHWFKSAPLSAVSGADVVKVVSIGATTTQALREAGVGDVIQVEQDDSEGVIRFFRSQPAGRRILFPRSDLALPVIPDALREMGHQVTPVVVYHTMLPTRPRRVNLATIQQVVFTSPSTIDNFLKLYGSLPPHIQYLTRGRTTEEYLKNRQNEKIPTS